MENTKMPNSATAYRRQRQIEDCLYENLLHRPYTSVSVSDLCHQLGLSRKSFYNYYPDKDACFRALVNRKIQECMLLLAQAAGEKQDLIATYLSYCRDEKVFFDIIVKNNLVFVMMDQLIRHLQAEHQTLLSLLDTNRLQNDPYVLSCYIAVNVTFVLQWYLENYATPLEEMVKKYQRLLYEPLLPMDNAFTTYKGDSL